MAPSKEPSPGEVPSTDWNRSIPPWLLLLLGLSLCLAALIVVPHARDLRMYKRHFTEGPYDVTLRLARFSAGMDEATVKTLLRDAPKLDCYSEPRERNRLGNRVCYTEITSADGIPALWMTYFFNDGKLSFILIALPWWGHGAMHNHLTRQFGRRTSSGTDNRGRPVSRWKLPNGVADMNENRARNPLTWSTVLWTAGL